ALKHLDDQMKGKSGSPEAYQQLANDLKFLGLLSLDILNSTGAFWVDPSSTLSTTDQIRIKSWIDRRVMAKELKNYNEADRIRKLLLDIGVGLKDGPNGTDYTLEVDFDPTKLDALK
ncbi:MAG: hypothetical protein WBC93_03345, partial [Sulfitobacter sp.]